MAVLGHAHDGVADEPLVDAGVLEGRLDGHAAQHGEAAFVFVQTPELVRQYAMGPWASGVPAPEPAKYAILDGPAAIIDAARSKPVQPPPGLKPGPPTPHPPEPLPDWVIPVGVGVGVLTLGGLALYFARR